MGIKENGVFDHVLTDTSKAGRSPARVRRRATKAVLLVLLGFLWAVRIAAIKAAGLSGVPVHVLIVAAALGLAAIFTARAIATSDWPPMRRGTWGFYALSGVMGFLAPFALESAVAPHLPVFVFVVVIATMPVLALLLSVLTGAERLSIRSVVAVSLGFACAVALLWDTSAKPTASASPWWVAAAFGVPLLYALNTVFVARQSLDHRLSTMHGVRLEIDRDLGRAGQG